MLPRGAYRHEAVLYVGDRGFLEATVPFVREGVAAGEPTLVVVIPDRAELMRKALGPAAGEVTFGDMLTLGRNPARIIPLWRTFVNDHTNRGHRRVRGVGEPIYAGRTPAEVVECERHEALLNVAFGPNDHMWLVCPYDRALGDAVIDEAYRNHPIVTTGNASMLSTQFRGPGAIPAVIDHPFAEPPSDASAMRFGPDDLVAVRSFISREIIRSGVDLERISEVLLAVNEMATNSVVHGGGGGTVRQWVTGDEWVCEVTDRGFIDDPLAGRVQPDPAGERGRGLWLVNQLCDLVEVRSSPNGSTIRAHVALHD